MTNRNITSAAFAIAGLFGALSLSCPAKADDYEREHIEHERRIDECVEHKHHHIREMEEHGEIRHEEAERMRDHAHEECERENR